MSKKLIDDFFEKNRVCDPDMPSAAAIAHLKIHMMKDAEKSEKFAELSKKMVFSDQHKRKEDVITEEAEIQAVTSFNEVIKFMRRGIDNLNDAVLVNKALSFEKELVPDVVKRLKTSLNTGFIELATRILSLCNVPVADDLVAYFDDVRSPYAQSMILVILGFQAGERHIPWIIEKYHQLRKYYPKKTYSDGAVYALTEIANRLYSELA